MIIRNGKKGKYPKVILLLAMSLIFTYLTVDAFANPALNESADEMLENFSSLIEFAQNRHTNSTEPGIHVTVGRHPTDARNAFQIAIDDATTVMMQPNLTEAEITAAYETLSRAIETFMNAMIDPGNAQNPNGFIRPYWREIAQGEDELQKRHLRATWISTVVNIDWPSIEARGTTPAHVDLQKAELRTRFDEMASMNMNAVIFQVGPTADAFYRSELVPWSAWLTGETNFQGNLYDSNGVSFDPLAYAIELAHARNMELHAWLNPYRVSHIPASYTTRGGVPIVLSSSGRPLNEYQADGYNVLQLIRDEWTRDFPGSAFDRFGEEVRIGENRYVLNPAIPDGRAWIVERVLEVIQNYDVDAIQFDDYFYPSDYFDDDSFLIFNTPEFNLISRSTHETHAAWRRENTEMMIVEVREAIRSVAPWVKFGISPVGVWRSGDGSTGYDGGGYSTGGLMQGTGSTSTTSFDNYNSVFADTRRWVIENKIDYLAPQIYWDWNLAAAPYGPIADWWGRLVHDYGPNGTMRNAQGEYTTTHIYLGMGLYRMDPTEFPPSGPNGIVGRYEWTNTAAFEYEGLRTWMRQEHYNNGNPYILGSMIFTQNQMRQTAGNNLPMVMNELRSTAWQQPALVPAMPHLGGLAPRNPVNVVAENDTISWSDGETSTSELIRTRYFVIYRSIGDQVNIHDARNIVAIVAAERDQVDYSFTIPDGVGDYSYVITAVNRLHDESDPDFVLVPDSNAPVIVNIDGNEVALSENTADIQGPIVTFTSNMTSETNGVREIEAFLNIDGTDHDVSALVRRQGTSLDTNITLVYRFAPEVILNNLPVSLTIRVTDGNDLYTYETVAFRVTAPEPPTITTNTLPNGEIDFVNTNWVTGGSYNNQVDIVTVDVQTEPNATNNSRVYAGMNALHWEIRDSGTPASALSGVEATALPQRDGENPTGIGFWIKITGSLEQLHTDRPVRMGLINGGYKWWNVPVATNRVNEWQWVEVHFADQAWNAGNVNFDYDPNQPLTIPGPGAGNANAFLWLRKTNLNLMEADIYIDNMTLLYGGITGGEANFDSEPPTVALTAINDGDGNDVLSGYGFNVLIEDIESGLDQARIEVLVNDTNVADQLSFTPKGLRATMTLGSLHLEDGVNEVMITAWDNFGFVTSESFTVYFDE